MLSIVTGLLETPAAVAARERAYEMAERTSGIVHLVGFLPAEVTDQSHGAEFQKGRAELQKRLDAACASARRDHAIGCEAHLVVGASRPSQAILDIAAEVDADLIVIGIRRRSRVGKLVLGSNAQDILMGANTGVLSVKADED